MGDVFEEAHIEYRILTSAPPKAEVKKSNFNGPVVLRASVAHNGVTYSVVYPDRALEVAYDLYLELDEPIEGLTLASLMKSGEKLVWLKTNFQLIATAAELKMLNAHTPKLYELKLSQLPEGVIVRDGSYYTADGQELLRYQSEETGVALLPYHLKRIAAYAFPARTKTCIIALPLGLEEIAFPQRDVLKEKPFSWWPFDIAVLAYTGISTGKTKLHARLDEAYANAPTAKLSIGVTGATMPLKEAKALLDPQFFTVTASKADLEDHPQLEVTSQGDGTLYGEEYRNGRIYPTSPEEATSGQVVKFYADKKGGTAYSIKEATTSKSRCAGFIYHGDTVRSNALQLAIWKTKDEANVIWCEKGNYLPEFDYRISPDGTTVTRFWHHTDSSLTLPALGSATRLGQAFLRSPGGLEELTIPSCYTELPPHAFAECPSIKRLTLENGGITLAPEALSDCSTLEAIYITDEHPPAPQALSQAFGASGLPKGMSIWVPSEKATSQWKAAKSSFGCPVYFVPEHIVITNSKGTKTDMCVRWHPQDDTAHQVTCNESVTLPRFARYTVEFHNSPAYDYMNKCDSADSQQEFKCRQEHIAFQDLTLSPHVQQATYAIVYSEPTGGKIVVSDTKGTVYRNGDHLPRGTKVNCKAILATGYKLENFLVNDFTCPTMDTTLTLHRELNLSLTTSPIVIPPVKWSVLNTQADNHAPKKSPILIADHEGALRFSVDDGEVLHIKAQTSPYMVLVYISLSYEDGRREEYPSSEVDVAITGNVTISKAERLRYTHFKFNETAKQRIIIVDRDLEIPYEDGDSCLYNTKVQVYHLDAKYEDLKSISLNGLEPYKKNYMAAKGDTAFINLEVQPLLATLTIPPIKGCDVALTPMPTLVDPDKGIYTLPLDTSLTISITPWPGWDYEYSTVPGTTGKIKPAKYTLYVQGPTTVNISAKPRAYTAEVVKNGLPGTLELTDKDGKAITKRTKLRYGDIVTATAIPEQDARTLGLMVNGKLHLAKHLTIPVDRDLQLAGVFTKAPVLCPYEFCLSPEQDTLLRAWTRARVINFAAEPLSKVKVIAPYALADNPYIERVTLAGQVSELGDNTFQHANNLWEVSLGPQLKRLNAQAFDALKYLRYLDLNGQAAQAPQFVQGDLQSALDTYEPIRIRVSENEVASFRESPSLAGYDVLPRHVNITIRDVPQEGSFVFTCYGDSIRTEQQLVPNKPLSWQTDGGARLTLRNQGHRKKQIDSVVVNGVVQYLPLELEAREDLAISFRHAATLPDRTTPVGNPSLGVTVVNTPGGILVRNNACGALRYYLYTPLGYELLSGDLSACDGQINLQRLAPGIYYLHLRNKATGSTATYLIVR